jgi:signal transduction histidine kinase
MHSDPQRVTQCLLNLLSNAAKFTQNGNVEMGVDTTADDCIEFAVADTGIGLSEEAQGQLFQRFEQIKSDAGQPQGTGLGLNLSKHLAKMMGGDILVESHQGSGSTFTLRLPLRCASASYT